MDTIRIFECFAGYGGASWGLKLANIPFEQIGFSEIKKNAIKCYKKNFPGVKNYGDITKINWEKVPDFDLLTGGFPCQDVSTQGKQDLSIGRTVLINELIKALKIKQPKYFLFENVSNIQADKFKEFLRGIRFDLHNAGYQVFFNELKSSNYGSPNARVRVWFIGYRNDIAKPFGFVPYPPFKQDFLVIDDILEHNVDSSYWLKPKHQFIIHNLCQFNEYSVFDLSQKRYPVLSRRKNEIVYYGQYRKTNHCSSYHVLDTNGVCQTLTCGVSPFWLIHNRIRKPTEKELFRVQGFLNDEIDLEGLSWNMCLDLAGDGWDVNLVAQIYKAMWKEELGE